MSTRPVVVITGASAGIGRATARLFAAKGARIALLARGQAGLDAAAREVEHAGGTALAIPTDMADAAQVERAADQVETTLGPIDIWVNDAFASVFAPFHQIEIEEFRRVTEVSYLGYVHGTKAALSRMRTRDRGTIVQVGSALGFRAIPLQSAYCGAKHAINGFTESVRTELLHEHSNIHITIAQMPAVNTPQFGWVRTRLPKHPQPVPPIYQPELAAHAVLYAAQHPRRKQYWVGSSTAATFLGQRLAPALLDRYLARTGYDSQQTDPPLPAGQPDNLFEPLDASPEDRGPENRGPSDHSPEDRGGEDRGGEDRGGEDRGAHGQFDDHAHHHDPQLWASHHPAATATALAGLVASIAGGIAWRHRG
jgi:NAD(P)-dependent dehydrogenase (short-subunit alcohol dehydrogenase family)